jgi:4-hydroxy-3-methylbut-2-enyl diphosphate reductase IspH
MLHKAKPGSYRYTSNNCEHLATLCRIGRLESPEVDEVPDIGLSDYMAVVAAVVAVAAIKSVTSCPEKFVQFVEAA